MRFFPMKVVGAYLIEPEPHSDARGVFTRRFCAAEFAAKGLEARVVQANTSENKAKHTLRGFHYQRAPHQEAKTITCLAGEAAVVVLDVRCDSETFGMWHASAIGDDRRAVYVPPGCAAAFMTLVDDTVLSYYSSGFYHQASERGVRWDDPAFNVKWPHEPAVISDKDKNWPSWEA